MEFSRRDLLLISQSMHWVNWRLRKFKMLAMLLDYLTIHRLNLNPVWNSITIRIICKLIRDRDPVDWQIIRALLLINPMRSLCRNHLLEAFQGWIRKVELRRVMEFCIHMAVWQALKTRDFCKLMQDKVKCTMPSCLQASMVGLKSLTIWEELS